MAGGMEGGSLLVGGSTDREKYIKHGHAIDVMHLVKEKLKFNLQMSGCHICITFLLPNCVELKLVHCSSLIAHFLWFYCFCLFVLYKKKILP